MKIKGRKISERNIVTLAIPRANGEDIILKFAAILDYSEFDAVCPMPMPGSKILKGGVKAPDFDSPRYKAQITDYSKKKTDWMVLKSISVTDGLEWESVDMADCSTWGNFNKEMTDAGFSDVELMRIIGAVSEANGLSEAKIKEAMDRFLAGEAEIQELSSSLPIVQSTTQSGELAKDGESVPQA